MIRIFEWICINQARLISWINFYTKDSVNDFDSELIFRSCLFQVNFFEDHTKLILSNVKGEYMVTFIDPDRCAKTYNMCLIIQDGCRPDIVDRMAFARSMLKNLVDIEGADIWGLAEEFLPSCVIFGSGPIRLSRLFFLDLIGCSTISPWVGCPGLNPILDVMDACLMTSIHPVVIEDYHIWLVINQSTQWSSHSTSRNGTCALRLLKSILRCAFCFSFYPIFHHPTSFFNMPDVLLVENQTWKKNLNIKGPCASISATVPSIERNFDSCSQVFPFVDVGFVVFCFFANQVDTVHTFRYVACLARQLITWS